MLLGLQGLPIPIIGIISFLCGSYFLYKLFRIESFNRIIGLAFVIFSFGNSIFAILISRNVLDTSQFLIMIKWSAVVSVFLLIFGIFISYIKGSEKQRTKWREAFKVLFIVLICLILFIVFIKLFL